MFGMVIQDYSPPDETVDFDDRRAFYDHQSPRIENNDQFACWSYPAISSALSEGAGFDEAAMTFPPVLADNVYA